MRLIDADEVIKKMNERAEEEILDFRDCRNIIEFAPTVNAIEIAVDDKEQKQFIDMRRGR